MIIEKLRTVLAVGENVAVEFKRCGNGIGIDTYETVCSFLNRFGGDIYLGIEDNGTVCGVPKYAAPDMVKNFINIVSNSEIINPTVYLTPEIVEYDGKHIIYIHIPPSSEVHSCKKVIYDRMGDADVKISATGQIAQMYIRKQKIYTEKKIYPYVTDEHLRLDMLPLLRQMAINRFQAHPWKNLSDSELLQSAGLIGEDFETGQRGYNLAAVMLLGRNDVIKNVCPTYRTDALLRKINTDRYDDRLIVETNLIDSYEQLMLFSEKHLWDKFYLEGDARISLRNAIAREILVNTLMHREFTSSYIAKFVIEKEQMTVSNANRAERNSLITPDDFEPNPKNPIIAAFFRNIGMADELGSGVRNLYKYSKRYSGSDPKLTDGDIFTIVVPLNDSFSFDAETDKAQNKAQIKRSKNDGDCALSEIAILNYLRENPNATQVDAAKAISKSRRAVQETIAELKEKGLLEREGAKKNGRWIVKR
ncbi:MAG: putative DNA binding domain-containing protein [Synergistaceae bacterium]|nr:putative DNA binding domain-containing protein [Synergistaceae bacterium]